MNEILFDLTQKTGKIKPVWGVNGGPETKVFTYDAKPLFREARFPSCRLHDVEYPYGSGEFVDIPCIFRDFDADETDPANYNFALTDLYIQKIIEVGAEPFFRLGVSIEHAPVKRHVFPPKDFEKWARICEHVIRHYNEGFADGFHYNIRYWEIWNEADGGDNMWVGTPEEYYRLYTVAAKHLKACFPELHIGGGGFTKARNKFIEGFFEYIQKERAPLDFYSWHTYHASPEKLKEKIAEAEAVKSAYGYWEAESILDEWNYMEDWANQAPSYRIIPSMKGAAFCAADLITLQHSPVEMAHYFEADVVKEWCGLFEVAEMSIGRHGPAKLRARKPFYAFSLFGEIAGRGEEVFSATDDRNAYALAAKDETGATGMIAFYGGDPVVRSLRVKGLPRGAEITLSVVNEEYTMKELVRGKVAHGEAQIFLPARENEIYALRVNFENTL